MTSTPLSTESSWVDISSDTKSICSISSHHTPVTTSLAEVKNVGLKQIEKLLLEAQRESNRDGDIGSNSISPISPCSPLADAGSISIIESMMLNREDLLERSRRISSDWLWDWSIQSDGKGMSSAQVNPTDWKTLLEQSTQQKKLSLRQWVTRRGFFSKEVLSIFLLSNILSLLLGAGIGYTVLIRRSL